MNRRSSTIQKYHRHVGETGSDSLERLLRWIPESAQVLDVGTATGALGEILSSSLHCRVDGVELDAAAAAVARCHYRRLVVADLDRSRLGELFPVDLYDVVVFADVLEHLRDPVSMLEEARGCLRPGGEVLISIPNVTYAPVLAELLAGRFDYRSTGILDDTHVRFYTRDSLRHLVELGGFELVELDRVVLPVHRSEFSTVLLESLPPTIRSFLESREEAFTYQFLARCGAREDRPEDEPRATVDRGRPSWPKLQFPVHLLWRLGDQPYRAEEQSVAWGEVGGGAQVLTLSLPDLDGKPELRGLRLDLADRAGWVELREVRVVGEGGEVLWSGGSGTEEVRSWPREALVVANPAPPEEGGGEAVSGVGLVIGERGGSLEVPVPEEILRRTRGAVAVEVQLSWPPRPDHLRIVEELRTEMQELRAAEERIRELDRQVRFLQGQLEERLELLREVESQYRDAVRERDRALGR